MAASAPTPIRHPSVTAGGIVAGMAHPDMPFENRELAWLAFNARVLEEAEDPEVPVLERLKFLAIFSSNLDEFFMIRVAGLWRQIDAGVTTPGPCGRSPRETLEAVSRRARALVAHQHRIFARILHHELRPRGVRIVTPARLDAAGRQFVASWFERTVHPVLTPMAIDPGHPFPHLANRAICLITELEPLEPDENLPQATRCVLHLPSGGLPRFLRVPGPGHRFVLLEDVLRAHLHRVFSGYRVRSATVIRVTRDGEFDVADDNAEDLLAHVEQAVRNRRMGAAVRLQYERSLPAEMLTLLRTELELDGTDLYPTTGPTALTDLMQLYAAIDLPALRDPDYEPRPVPGFGVEEDCFAHIRAGDVLVHHPYQSFGAVTRFIEAAADDPDVIAIKMTLYRVSATSRIAEALARAAQNGKEVAVLVELRARFSEESNIAWAKRLEATGAHVVYGIVGLKTHCKAALVIRREGEELRRYVHLGTGNYNHRTARTYTDLGLFTVRASFAEDLTHVFNLLTGYVRPPALHHLVLSPNSLRNWLLERLDEEVANARAGRPAGLFAKLNAVSDPTLIRALYAASEAGVPIRLIVRGICCLRPGLPGVSSRIEVIRLVDRFLEHARIVRFENGGRPTYHITSADWMPRNLDGRIEILAPVLDPPLRRQIQTILDVQWEDTVKARLLGPDGSSRRREGPRRRAQQELMDHAPNTVSTRA